MSARVGFGSVRLRCTLSALLSASRASSDSMRASACQLPLTSSNIANSEPSAAMRLSAILPPQSVMTRVSSWTIPVRSLPMAETARCCFIASQLTVDHGSVPGLTRLANDTGGSLASGWPAPVTSRARSLV